MEYGEKIWVMDWDTYHCVRWEHSNLIWTDSEDSKASHAVIDIQSSNLN